MRSLTAFTVCMWMSSSDTEGGPFSYAVSSEDNELLIYYERYFQLFIGGEKRLGIQYCAIAIQTTNSTQMNGISFRIELQRILSNFTWLCKRFRNFGDPFVRMFGLGFRVLEHLNILHCS